MLLGLVIEKLSGMSYFDYVRRNIFQKAGMVNANFYEADIPNRNVAFSYTKNYRYVNDTTKYYNTFFIAPVKGSPAGGAYASAEDLARFVEALTTNKLLSKKFTDTVTTGKVVYGNPEQQKKYAYGFANQVVNNKRIIFHDGGANGISTDVDIYPDLGYAVIVLSNYDHPLGWEVVKKTRSIITK
jgi:CubicO group peptidase (beta-lactamase class C family)